MARLLKEKKRRRNLEERVAGAAASRGDAVRVALHVAAGPRRVGDAAAGGGAEEELLRLLRGAQRQLDRIRSVHLPRIFCTSLQISSCSIHKRIFHVKTYLGFIMFLTPT